MTDHATSPLRFLVMCSSCQAQFDATALSAGSVFHCSCGTTVKVPRRQFHDAVVVRCSSCSAPRTDEANACGHCGADFTLRERDLHTICPACMTRIANAARFCHGCGTAIVVQADAGQPTKSTCPSCGEGHTLNSRALDTEETSVLECPECTGLWIGRASFEILTERVRKSSASAEAFASKRAAAAMSGAALQRKTVIAQSGPLYRRCPECDSMMNRRNFSKRSGVIIDTCSVHGYWFDAEELERVLSWIRAGGELASRKREASEERDRKNSAASQFASDQIDRMAGRGTPVSSYSPFDSSVDGDGFVVWLIRTVLGRWTRLP